MSDPDTTENRLELIKRAVAKVQDKRAEGELDFNGDDNAE